MIVKMTNEELVQFITKTVMREFAIKNTLIPIGVSNHHVHLDREDMDILFGQGVQLTKLKDLKQPGQYAAKELVTIKGPKGEISKVRILGPLRKQTQIEISATDGFKLGVKAPVKESGQLEDSPGIEIIGPNGSVKKDYGTIVALRHIHMTPEIANSLGVVDKEIVDVEVGGKRGAILRNVLIRVSDKYALEMHLDMDEANAVSVKNDDGVRILK